MKQNEEIMQEDVSGHQVSLAKRPRHMLHGTVTVAVGFCQLFANKTLLWNFDHPGARTKYASIRKHGKTWV